MAKGRHQAKKAARQKRTYEEELERQLQRRESFLATRKAQALALIKKNRAPDPEGTLGVWWSMEQKGLIAESERLYPLPPSPEKEKA